MSVFSKIGLIFYISLLLTFGGVSQASEKVWANGQTLLLKDVDHLKGEVTSGYLVEETDIKFGANTLKSVPQGTHVAFLTKSSGSEKYISLMTFTEEFQDQDWTVGDVKFKLNCGAYVDRPQAPTRVVTFYENHQLNGRCRVMAPAQISTPDGGEVVVARGSETFFTENGLLKSATLVEQGYVFIENQKVEVRNFSYLDFYDRGGIHFLYLKDDHSIVLPTKLSPFTSFTQPAFETPLALMFHENGVVESGRIDLKEKLVISPKILDKVYDLEVIEGPMAFDEIGRPDRVFVKEGLVIKLEFDVNLYLTEPNTRRSTAVPFKTGDTIPVPPNTPLFLRYVRGQLQLESFPVNVQGGIYVLSFPEI